MDIKIPSDILPDSTFTCGPSQGHPEIREVKLKDTLFERSHRASDITKNGMIKEATENLRELLHIPKDYVIMFFLGGATPALDSVSWGLTKDSISGLRFGSFSNLWGKKIANNLDESIKKTFYDAEEEGKFPSQDPDWNASLVLLTPNETSMGLHTPNDYLEMAWSKKGKDTLIAWDCTSCAGGRDLPHDKYDAMVFSLQKCFGVPGGTGVLILSPRAVERAMEVKKTRNIPFCLDLQEPIKRATEKYQTLNTPSNTNIWVMNESCKWMLKNGGIKGMDKLSRQHYDYMMDFIKKSDYLEPYVKDERFRSYVTLTIEITDPKIEDTTLNGFIMASGKENLKDGIKKYSSVKTNSLRVACFPYVDINGVGEYEKLTKTIDYIVNEIRKQK
jgi:phosphoserine aminotransferase